MSSPAFPQPYMGPAGAAQLSAPLQPPPPPPAPPVESTPHPGEDFTPGQMAFYEYHHPADREGINRAQLVIVTHVDESHVHGLVLGDARNLASFAHGQLTHGYPTA